ncbi:MAG TPA: glycosyltransferase [Humisphaera sp.]|jgi:GT2 family glycosyltransferase|nr:glycosyltransferase [Humisphaera sp.]
MYDLSIVIPTCNRATLLSRGLSALQEGVGCSFEVIVVDGASEDGTRDVLDQARDQFGDAMKVIRETRREGFVRAANKGFRAATGRNLTWLNDDARPLPGSLDNAVAQMDAADDGVGFLAMFHRWHSTRNVAYETVHNDEVYRLCHVRGTLYANFAMGRRVTFERLNYFDERYFFFAADPDLSLKAWHAGLRIEPAYASLIEHDEHDDDRRFIDTPRGQEDNQKLFAKWDLPPKNIRRNDFDPANPCTLLGLRSTSAIAA